MSFIRRIFGSNDDADADLTLVVAGRSAKVPAGSEIPPRPASQVTLRSTPPVWLGKGQSTTIAGISIPGGMIYVGSSKVAGNRARDPSLIDPEMPIIRMDPDWTAPDLPYYPSYQQLPTASRGAYLRWLSEGRKRPNVPIGYVFIFFYGLERRAFVDAESNSLFRPERAEIEDEVRRLLDLYGAANASFRQYATSFLGMLQILDGSGSNLTPPSLGEDRWNVPPALRLTISSYAEKGEPVPAEWALAWSHFRSERWPRTPSRRLPESYAQLFALRYTERFGAGIVPARGWQPLRLTYRPASSALPAFERTIGTLRDSYDDLAAIAALGQLSESVEAELGPLSKWRKRNPDAALNSVPALAVLPEDLLDRIDGEALEFLQWLHGQIGPDDMVTVPAIELLARWPVSPLTKTEAAQIARSLNVLGFGIEPDVRFGGPVPTQTDQVVIFRMRIGQEPPGSPSLATAMVMVQLASGVAVADSGLAESEALTVVQHVADRLELSAGERERIAAHLSWQTTRAAKPAALRARIRDLTPDQRRAAGDLIIAVAAADGLVTASETKLVQRVFGMLELNPDDAIHRLFDASAGNNSSRGPVTSFVQGTAPSGFALDSEVITSKVAQSNLAASIIAQVFAEDEDEIPTIKPAPAAQPDGLRDLLEGLSGQETWTRAAFERLCAAQSILPLAAIDQLNERSMEECDEPLVEGDDPLHINSYALEALSR